MTAAISHAVTAAAAPVPGTAARKLGNWVHHPDTPAGPAWELTGSGELTGCSWWLRRRTGATESLRWCGYCWLPPYRWWMLYRVPPAQWRLDPGWDWSARREEGYGHCTHRHDLPAAMAATEQAFDRYTKELIFNALTRGAQHG